MAARTKARKRALDVLFESEQRRVEPLETWATRVAADDPLTTYAPGWSLDRMPAVDRTILRLGAYELLWRDDIPDAVAISEAVGLARDLSTDESPGFVNGLLARLLELKPTLAT